MPQVLNLKPEKKEVNQNEKTEFWFNFRQTNYLLIYFDLTFYIVIYEDCSNIDLVEAIMKKLKSKKSDILYKRSIIYDKDLINFRLRDIKLQKTLHEVNYIYGGFNKQYCFLSKLKFKENWLNGYNYKLLTEYNETLEVLNDLKLNDYLLKDLENLYNENRIIDMTTEVQIFKSVEDLSNKLTRSKTIK